MTVQGPVKEQQPDGMSYSGLRSTIFRNFSQFPAIYRNFPQFPRNFLDLPILHACWCPLLSMVSWLRRVTSGIAIFPQFFAIGFDPPRPQSPPSPAAVQMPAVVRMPACHSRRFQGERPIGAATG